MLAAADAPHAWHEYALLLSALHTFNCCKTSIHLLRLRLLLQSRSGLQGLDPFQLVALLLKLLKLDKPTQGDDVADYQQFVASGEARHGSSCVCCFIV